MAGRPKSHPIPLELIRGYAKECGLKIGRIVQTDLTTDRSTAVYLIKIEGFPDGRPLSTISPSDLLAALDVCFPRPELKATTCTWTGTAWYFNLWALRKS